MSAPDPTEAGVFNAFFGAGGPPPPGAPGFAPSDAVIMYKGATKEFFPWAQLPNGGYWAWTLRGMFLTFISDLLRVMVPQAPTGVTGQPYGFRDSVNSTLFLAEQNNQILRAIAAKTGTDISSIVGK
jgi:hypothetical protein